jgi:hypothetical protein
MSAAPDNEDDLAEFLAERASSLVDESHPQASPAFRRRLARLYLRQLTGSERPPGQVSSTSLAKALGVDRREIPVIEAQALATAWRTCITRFPDLLKEL